jgi:integrase
MVFQTPRKKPPRPVLWTVGDSEGGRKRVPFRPARPPNSTLRSREYLTELEVEALIAAAKANRHGHRDSTAILVTFRHGLRASELANLRWEQVDFARSVLHVTRQKNGTPSVHPLGGRELRALRRLRRESPTSEFVFVSERGAPLSSVGFAKMVARLEVDLEIKVHAHMLRHACGFVLANAGQDTRSIQQYLGHKNISNTVKYTELLPNRFRSFWKD